MKLRSGALSRPKKKRTAQKNRKLRRLKRKFNKGKVLVEDFIRSIGYIFGPKYHFNHIRCQSVKCL